MLAHAEAEHRRGRRGELACAVRNSADWARPQPAQSAVSSRQLLARCAGPDLAPSKRSKAGRHPGRAAAHSSSRQLTGFPIARHRTRAAPWTCAGTGAVEAIFTSRPRRPRQRRAVAAPDAGRWRQGWRQGWRRAQGVDAAHRARRAERARGTARPLTAAGQGPIRAISAAPTGSTCGKPLQPMRDRDLRCLWSAAGRPGLATLARSLPVADRHADCRPRGLASATTGASAITRWSCTIRCTSITCRTCRSRRAGRPTSPRTSWPHGSRLTSRAWSSTTGPAPNSRRRRLR